MALFDCVAGVHIWVKVCEGRYRAMNRASLLDYSLASLAEAQGKTDFDLSPTHNATQSRKIPWIMPMTTDCPCGRGF